VTATDETAPMTEIQALVGRGDQAKPGADPVNEPMIRHWCEALGDANPVYTDAVAAASV
jgi:acyl dehydratase